MTRKLKELIENAPIKQIGWFGSFMFYPLGKYDGFFKENGYQRMMSFGFSEEDKKWYVIGDQADVFCILSQNINSFNLDISTEYKIPRIWFDKPIYIDNAFNLSTIMGKIGGK
jgi:hypothetical protein